MIVQYRCSRCGETKPHTEFSAVKGSRARRPVQSWCRKCKALHVRERRTENPEATRARDRARYATNPEPYRQRARDQSRRKLYGLTPEQFQEMVQAQVNLCLICMQPSTTRNGEFHVDHDHATGKVRGLLCQYCNNGLGNFRDSIALLRRAIAYLQERT